MSIKYWVVNIFLLLCINKLHAQTKYGERLYDSLATSNNEDYHSVIATLTKALPKVLSERDTTSFMKLSNFLSVCYYYTKDFENMEDNAISTFQFAKNNPPKDPSVFPAALSNYTFVLKKKGNLIQAINGQRKVIEYGKSANIDPHEIGVWHLNLATSLGTFGDFEQAVEFSKKAIEYFLQVDQTQYEMDTNFIPRKIHKAQYSIGDFLRKADQLIESERYLEKSLNGLQGFQKPNEQEQKLLIDAHLRLADIYSKTNRFDGATKSIAHAQNFQKKLSYRNYLSHEILGKLNLEQNNFSIAKMHFEKSNSIAQKVLKKSKEFPIRSRLLMNLGDYYRTIGSTKKAIALYQDGLKFLDADLSDDIKDNPTTQGIGTFDIMLQLLHRKSKAAAQLYYDDGAKQTLTIALDSYRATSRLLDHMRSSYLTDGSKFFVAEKSFSIYAEYLEMLHLKYKLLPTKETLDEIIQVIDKNKSAILFESLMNKLKLISSTLPAQIVEEEIKLRNNISYYQKQISEYDDPETEPLEKLKNNLFDANKSYALLKDMIKDSFPDYYHIKIDDAPTHDIKRVQEKLKESELLLEYFQNGDAMFILSISQDTASLEKTIISDLNGQLQQYFYLLSQKPKSQDIQLFNDISRELYRQLVENQLIIHGHKKSLIVIADGGLGKIPFETFNPSASIDQSSVHYLIDSHDVTYYYSINQLLRQKESTSENKLLGFAPSFNSQSSVACNGTVLNKLPYADQELKSLSKKFSGRFLSNKAASKNEFLKKINDQSIVHLATHACLNQENPMLSSIHFTDGYLTNYDIKNLNIAPPFLVLSACNTGQGAIKKGEGIISLTRGFFEAGVQSLQSSLWSINDQSTSQIMQSMYTHLDNGETKSNALRLAKISFIEQADKARKHPFYWAGMIQIGNNQPIAFKEKGKFNLLLLGIIVLIPLVILWLLYTMRQRQDG